MPNPDESVIQPTAVPQIIAQAAEVHRQEAERIGEQLLQAVAAAPPPTAFQNLVQDLNQRVVEADGIPAVERPAPETPAPFTPVVDSEEWDDEEPDPFADLPQPATPVTIAEALQQVTTNEMSEEYKEVPSGFPNPEPGELIMTRAQLGRCRKADIKEKRVRVISLRNTEPPVPGWWAGFGLGYADGKAGAALFTYAQMMDLSAGMTDTYLYVVYDPPPVAPVDPNAPVRKCNWGLMLGSQLVAMIQIAPKNSTFRARVMALMKEPIPDECVTAEQIKDWIEFNFPRAHKAPDNSLDLNFRMNYGHIEEGTCNYRRRVRGTYSGRLTKEQLAEIVRDNPDEDFDHIMAIIRERCEEMARENGLPAYERIEETNHNVEDSTDHDSDMLTSIRGPVIGILKEVLTEEEVSELGI